jgi:hypothetical protein
MVVSEDSSETPFLLVENYNYDRFRWSSDRRGIFDNFSLLFIAACALCEAVEKRLHRIKNHYHSLR